MRTEVVSVPPADRVRSRSVFVVPDWGRISNTALGLTNVGSIGEGEETSSSEDLVVVLPVWSTIPGPFSSEGDEEDGAVARIGAVSPLNDEMTENGCDSYTLQFRLTKCR